MTFQSLTTLLTLLLTLTNAFNLTYPVANTTITVQPSSNFTIRWTSSPADPAMVNLNIQANTRGGNPQELCTNVTTTTNHCVVMGESVDFDNGPDWEMVVVNSADPGSPATPGTGDVIFVSQPFALYLYGSSASATGSAASATAAAMPTTTSGVGATYWTGRIRAVFAGIAVMLL